MTLYRLRGMEEFLSDTHVIDGKQYCIYGGATYPLQPWLEVGYPNVSATDEERLYKCMHERGAGSS